MDELKSQFSRENPYFAKVIRRYYGLRMQFSSVGGWKIADNVNLLDRTFAEGGFETYFDSAFSKSVVLIGGSTVWGWGANGLTHTLGGKFFEHQYNVNVLARPAFDFFKQFLLYVEYSANSETSSDIYWFVGINEYYKLINGLTEFISPRDLRVMKLLPNFHATYYGTTPLDKYLWQYIKQSIWRIKRIFRFKQKTKPKRVKSDDLELYLLRIQRLLSLLPKNIKFVLEPCLLTKEELSPGELKILENFGADRRHEYEHFCNRLNHTISGEGFVVIDARNLDLTNKCHYWDYCHWSPIIVREIYEKIRKAN